MYDVNDDAKGGFRRIEILTGPGRCRRWSAEQKARIVAEALAPGARVSEVARRWQVCPQQVFAWRHAAHPAVATMPRETTSQPAAEFVPIITEVASPATSVSAAIEVKLAGAVVRLASSMDATMLTAVLRAVRASVSPI
jgi:transposase